MSNFEDIFGKINQPSPLDKVDIAALKMDIKNLKEENRAIKKKLILLWDEILTWRKPNETK